MPSTPAETHERMPVAATTTSWWRRWPFVAAVLLSMLMLFSPASGVPGGPPHSDKVVHALIFAVLAGTGRLAGLSWRQLALGLAAYAIASEVLQSLLPINRHGDPLDAVTDLVGVALGLLLTARLPGAGRGR